VASENWARYRAVAYLRDLLGELIPEHLDLVTLDPHSTELSPYKRAAWIRGGGDEHEAETHHVNLDATILIRLYGSTNATEGVSLALERMLAEVRDHIHARRMDFHQLDPPMQYESASVVDDPAFSAERDLSALTLAVSIRTHR
jgi:hypothetical protein